MPVETFAQRLDQLQREYAALIERPNAVDPRWTNGWFDRYVYPVATGAHAPLFWRYDLNPATNPFLMERLGVNGAYNTGAIELDGKILLVLRMEGNDRKSFFAVAESETGVDRFRFWDYPVVIPETEDPDTNVYDMRLTRHEDGWIYGVFCTERKDPAAPPQDMSSAVAQAGIARTKDLKTWERLPDLKTPSAQQRNVVLHPEFVDGKYAFYTRPQDSFIDAGSGGGIGWGLCADITRAEVFEETIIDPRAYHTIKESKNGAGAVPDQDREGLAAHRPRRARLRRRSALCAVCLPLRPARALEGHRPPGRLLPGPRVRRARGRCLQRGLLQRGCGARQRRPVYLLRLVRHAHPCRHHHHRQDAGLRLQYPRRRRAQRRLRPAAHRVD